jgi:translation elongation factor EF-G
MYYRSFQIIHFVVVKIVLTVALIWSSLWLIPKEYVPAVNKGIQEQMENGVLAGFPFFGAAVYFENSIE